MGVVEVNVKDLAPRLASTLWTEHGAHTSMFLPPFSIVLVDLSFRFSQIVPQSRRGEKREILRGEMKKRKCDTSEPAHSCQGHGRRGRQCTESAGPAHGRATKKG